MPAPELRGRDVGDPVRPGGRLDPGRRAAREGDLGPWCGASDRSTLGGRPAVPARGAPATVQDVTATVTVPRQAGPVDPAPAPVPVPARLVGRERPFTPEERQFVLGAYAMFLVLLAVIVAELLLDRFVWA